MEKSYSTGFRALSGINLEINRGEIFALLGPNGAGKTTLINIICGLVNRSSGRVLADGYDIVTHYKEARRLIGLVPQELTGDMFVKVLNSMQFSRGLYGKSPNPEFLEQTLRSLSLWDKRNERIRALSGGMKRRLMIAKALSHEPRILFLDEPTAGVDVNLRRDMWALMRKLRESGVTIVLTTHYIEEAEEMADRIGIIDRGQIVLAQEKSVLMQKLGKKKVTVKLSKRMIDIPPNIAGDQVKLSPDGLELTLTFETKAEKSGVNSFMRALANHNIEFDEIQTAQSSLEEIFLTLIGDHA